MQIFKFGGASLKTANAVKNMTEIVCGTSERPLTVIVSAMGKTTNALEEILHRKLNNQEYLKQLTFLEKYHSELYAELLPNEDELSKSDLTDIFKDLRTKLNMVSIENDMDRTYDDIISFGELLSSRIIAEFLNHQGVRCQLIDARKMIRTDSCFKEGKIIWSETTERIRDTFKSIESDTVVLSQGFIGSTMDEETTTLGREGSDFSAAIFASALEAESVTFWKDVPGIMNADPKLIKDPVLLDHLPYQEAAEMTYYGAKVIHPKTIRPLANKQIPLFVKGFDQPQLPGTSIKEYDTWERIPVIIYKHDQCLVTCKFTDFSFVNEESLVRIFDALHELDIKVNMMQNSAISFSVCIDRHPSKTQELINRLSNDFNVHYNDPLTLVTIKNFDNEALAKYRPDQEILLEQQTRANYRAVIRS